MFMQSCLYVVVIIDDLSWPMYNNEEGLDKNLIFHINKLFTTLNNNTSADVTTSYVADVLFCMTSDDKHVSKMVDFVFPKVI